MLQLLNGFSFRFWILLKVDGQPFPDRLLANLVCRTFYKIFLCPFVVTGVDSHKLTTVHVFQSCIALSMQ